MKLLISTLLLFAFSTPVLAEDTIPDYAPETVVAEEDLSLYKEALRDAFLDSGLPDNCNYPEGYYNMSVKDFLAKDWDKDVSLHLLESPTPLFVVRQVESSFVADFEFYSNEAFTEVIKARYVTYKISEKRVNKGNLVNPDFQTVVTTKKIIEAECSIDN